MSQPPNDLEAEKAVIGAAFADAEACEDTIADLRADEFYFLQNRPVWLAVQALFRDRKPVDLVTVVDWLRSNGKLDEAGGASWVSALSGAAFTAEQAKHHARIVRDKAVLRRIREVAGDAIRRASAGESPGPILSELANLAETADEASEQGCRTAREAADDLIRELQQMADSGEARSFTTGVEAIDGTFWVKPTDLFVIGGRPGTGKSFLAIQIAKSIAASGRGVLYVSCEMNDTDQVARAARSFADLDAEVFRKPTSPERVFKAASAVDKVGRLPLWFTTKNRVDQILRMARQKIRKGEIEALVVDFLQKLGLPDTGGTTAERLGAASRSFKELALEENAPVFLLSSMNRGAVDDDSARPTMAALRGSGDIESDADTVLLLHRKDDWETEWIVGKARESANGNDRGVLRMRRDFQRGVFEMIEAPTKRMGAA